MRPSKIAIYIWAIIALLAVICMFVPRDGWYLDKLHLRWPTMEHMLGIEVEIDTIEEQTKKIQLEKIDTTGIQIQLADTLPPEQQETIIENVGTRIYLHAFYQSLDSAQQMPIRVVYFGDSQIEEDRMTSILRDSLQSKYGGYGVGILPLHQTIPTITTKQRLYINGQQQINSTGPKRHIVYSRNMKAADNDYGVMGQVALMDDNLVPGSESVRMTIEPFSKTKSAHYFNRVRLLSRDVNGSITTNDTTIPLSANQVSHLPKRTTHATINLQGQGKVYGISLESDHGVIVDNIPMRACSGDIFTSINSAALGDYFASTNTRLIILQYGGNSIKNSTAGIDLYVKKNLRAQVQYLRKCAPQAAILLIGPSDMTKRSINQETSYENLPFMDRTMEQMAREEKIGYWSLYHAMGGKNSMITWKEKGLSGNDGIHFTQKGARKAGQMLTKWIDEGNIFKK